MLLALPAELMLWNGTFLCHESQNLVGFRQELVYKSVGIDFSLIAQLKLHNYNYTITITITQLKLHNYTISKMSSLGGLLLALVLCHTPTTSLMGFFFLFFLSYSYNLPDGLYTNITQNNNNNITQ